MEIPSSDGIISLETMQSLVSEPQVGFPTNTYSKTCIKRPLKKKNKIVFKTDYRLMQVKSIAECSKGSILQYFRPSLSYHLSVRSLFCLFLSGHFRQVLLYTI